MNINNIKIISPKDIKPAFYEASVKDIKKVLKSNSFYFLNATVTDEYDDNEHIVVVIRVGRMITYGCDDGMPWIQAYNATKLFKKMEDIGFKSSFFKIEPVDPTDKKFTEEPHILNIGFIKNVPKSAVNKN